jgi:hypothetical protein
MKTNKLLIVLVLAVALLGCGKREPRHIVILPDVSGSIKRESLEQAFKAIGELARHLQRGDRLTIIPILGDAEAEASGKILRFEVPANRQPYDGDLRSFPTKLYACLAEMRASALAHRGSKTDILGSIKLAEQEFEAVPEKSTHILLVLSDFIEEDSGLDFRRDGRLATSNGAKEFAAKLLKDCPIDFRGARIYLGLLRSSEYTGTGKSRRNALAEFWIQYFNLSSGHPTFVNDGLGLLQNAMPIF